MNNAITNYINVDASNFTYIGHKNILNLFQPDWTTPITKPSNGFTADTYGVAVAQRVTTQVNQGLIMNLNGIQIMGGVYGIQYSTTIITSPLLYPGDVISFDAPYPQTLKFYPLKEVI